MFALILPDLLVLSCVYQTSIFLVTARHLGIVFIVLPDIVVMPDILELPDFLVFLDIYFVFPDILETFHKKNNCCVDAEAGKNGSKKSGTLFETLFEK